VKTSIVILTYNKLEYTKQCIESIREFTEKDSYELIVVDNNSTDETTNWLKEQKDIKTIFNEDNKGFPKGCNQGIELATGDNVLLLNNDTVVAKNWLDNLITALYSDETVGAVGPVTNNCSNAQSIAVPYNNIEEMKVFAEIYNKSNSENWEHRLILIGFCLLVKKDVVDKIGLLDERFSPGNYEDDDYCFRITEAGYKLILCKDTFIHHYGSVSFGADSITFNNLMFTNGIKFKDKWGFNIGYSCGVRNDILSLMDSPKDKAINVLEVGCACGATLIRIKDIYKNANLYGVEYNLNAAKIAEKNAKILGYNIETDKIECEEEFFDYIIFGDVLEHLYDPSKVLLELKKFLKKDGFILASIPNVMHYSVIRGLLNGNWTYEDAGLLDRTHLRFFTYNEIRRMLISTGYIDRYCLKVFIGKGPSDDEFINKISELIDDSLKWQLDAYQYIFKAQRVN
jgi:GT2 family glycosyltransferase